MTLDDTDSDSVVTGEDEAEVEDEQGETRKLNRDDLQSFSVIQLTGGNKRPQVRFTPAAVLFGLPVDSTAKSDKYHLAYKIVKTECKLVRNLLNAHGFHEVHPNSTDFNLMWTGSHLKPYTLRGLLEFQKINHFPRSYEITRKDRLYKNIQRLQHSKGLRNFDFIPESYVLPTEFNEFYASYLKDKGPWIVKPVASSRGRGIFLVNHPNQIPLDEQLLICKYINNPLLIDGFKFDVRLYIGVTSYDPLRVYLYEEGLTRFATVKYDKGTQSLKSSCMHLTNYSINKKSTNYVRCQDPEVEDYGNKWSMSAMLRYLKRLGKDTTSLMLRIEDVIIKTLISGEMHIATACKMFMPHEGNCFEIYGFDILIDESLKPWLLEVNLSPSMACDSPLDLKIKSNLISDMFNLVGFAAQDPMLRRTAYKNHTDPYLRSRYQRYRSQSAGPISVKNLSRVGSAGTNKNKKIDLDGLSTEELRILRTSKDEYQRRGNFLRIFPSPDSWDIYGSFLEHKTTHNHMLHMKLFPGRSSSQRPSSATFATKTRAAIPSSSQIQLNPAKDGFSTISFKFGQNVTERMGCYEKKLESWSMSPSSTPSGASVSDPVQPASMPQSNPLQGSLVQGELEVRVQTAQEVTDGQVTLQQSVQSVREHISREVVENTTIKPRLNIEPEPCQPPRPLSAKKDYLKVLRVEDILERAGHLTKLQAREAFAMYLQRVQQRLMQEIVGYDSDDSRDSCRQEDQIILVLRFLKKAAVNLHTPFKVTVPSQKLTMSNRRRILAKQLGDFVHLYGKETAQIQQKQQASVYLKVKDEDIIPSEIFTRFMATASETELEELLTTYTRVNRNASIFLGSKTDKSSTSATNAGDKHSKEEEKPPAQEQSAVVETPKQVRSQSASVISKDRPVRSVSDLSSTESVPSMLDRHSRHLSAVVAYGNSIAVKSRQRPASARTPLSTQTSKGERPSRPVSAKVYKEKLSSEDQKDMQHRTIINYLTSIAGKPRPASASAVKLSAPSEKVVGQALQRLAEKQSARTYSADSPTNGSNTKQWNNLLKDFGIDEASAGPKEAFTDNNLLIDATKSKHHVRAQSANATFDSFVSYAPRAAGDGASDEYMWQDKSSIEQAPSSAMSYYSAQSSSHSKVGHTRSHLGIGRNDKGSSSKQNYTGKTLSREDYNKHLQDLHERLGEEKQQGLPPHPPSRPRRIHRPVSSQRMNRLVGAVEGTSLSKSIPGAPRDTVVDDL